ncbi:MAG TPA: HEAT repeat domain-containing protein, partial [Nitrolancea sp.]|nr:HEAT repeat domain-containing protein [Nitrolancea sp.]
AVGVLEDAYDARYFIDALANHDHTPQNVRTMARLRSAEWFPLRDIWRQMARHRPRQVLCVQNIDDGQGDEMIRTVPLLQALIDDNPLTRITLITNRAYLYNHPRIEVLSFDDSPSIAEALNRPLDGIIEFFEPNVLHLNHDIELAYSIARLRSRIDLDFDIQASKKWNHFTFDNVWIGGLDWASALELDRLRDSSVYDPVSRLIAELGLPLRIGEQRSRSESILVGAGRPEADFDWEETTRSNTEQRPVALLNPFGGGASLKGFVPQKFDDLATLVASVVAEGYFVVICPSGAEWGLHDAINALLTRLPDSLLEFITIASSSSVADNSPSNRGTFPATVLASETMSGYISFVSRADLIVTVEGWMMHAAFLLAKPYRVLLLAESGGRDWQPWGRSRRQGPWLFQGDPLLDHPPLPERPRKDAWLELLKRIADLEWYAFLRTVERSDDRDIRAATIRALGRIGGADVVSNLVSLLEDRSHIIRSVAADAMLKFHRDAVGRDEIPGSATLEAYRQIGATPFAGWEPLLSQGAAALPALHAALHGDDPIKRREAAIVLERMSRNKATEAVPASLNWNR